MQVASSAYSSSIPHSHYHSYYQIHPPGPQDHELKRQYLTLLPPHKIIEICLTFDINVPPYVKSTIWPPDINAAIAELQKTAQSSTEKPTEDAPPKEKEAVMDSLKSPDPPESSRTNTEPTPAVEPQPPDKDHTASTTDPASTSSSSDSSTTSPSTENLSTTSTTTAASASTPAPVPTPTPAPVPPMPMAQPQYPHQPYGYGHPPAYPISPYYTQAAGAYSYPYGYATSMQGAYHQPAPATYPPQPSVYSSMVPLSHPPQPQPPQMEGGDDLPSYEEMIVEALTGCVDPEGWAPKDLFAWMASRYPLQSNFRPSASQALQKAYKRGRFEKSSNGKYRLNATWEGGNTTRRTTRRPQTQPTQSNTSSTPVPPFTHAPLVHHHNHTPTTTQPYGYPSYSQTTFSSYPQSQPSTSTAPGTIAGAAAAAAAAVTAPVEKSTTAPASASAPTANANTDTEHSADAYEAAQNILSAINFGDLYKMSSDDQQKNGGQGTAQDQQQHATAESSANNGVEQLLSHVQAMLASSAANSGAQSGTVGPNTNGIPMSSFSQNPMSSHVMNGGAAEDPRAELQGQLALLAAQLAEIAQIEDAAHALPSLPAPQQGMQQGAPPPPVMAPAPPSTLSHNYQEAPSAPAPAPPVSPPAMYIHAPVPVTATETSSVSEIAQGMPAADSTAEIESQLPIQLEEEEEEESDDDDMEEII